MRYHFQGFAFLACLLAIGVAAHADSLLTDLTLVDVETGTLTEGQSVLIREGIVAGIGTDMTPTDGSDVIEGADGYLVPGLWDSHFHIFSGATEPDTALPRYLLHGVAGIGDMGAPWPIEAQQELQARIKAGEVVGSSLVLSGAWVDGSPGSWPGMFLADTPDKARAVVDRIASEGWAAVKSYSMPDEPTCLALADAAEAEGLALVGHFPERIALGTAIDAGTDGMEHFGRVTMASATAGVAMIADLRDTMAAGADLPSIFEIMAGQDRIILDTWDEALCAEILARIAVAGMHVSPTLVVADFYTGNWPAPDAPRMRMIPTEVREARGRPDFRLEAMTDEERALAEDSIALYRLTFLKAHRAGVPIRTSSDASFANRYLFHGFSLLDELDLYVEIGLTLREALCTATVAPPRFFDLRDHDGTIAPGRRAGLALLDANPLESLATLRHSRAVIAGGIIPDRATLDALEATLLSEGE